MPDPPATFRQLVRDMRALQKAEAREPSRSSRRAALKLELRVDEWLARDLAAQAQQVEWEEARHDDA